MFRFRELQGSIRDPSKVKVKVSCCKAKGHMLDGLTAAVLPQRFLED